VNNKDEILFAVLAVNNGTQPVWRRVTGLCLFTRTGELRALKSQ